MKRLGEGRRAKNPTYTVSFRVDGVTMEQLEEGAQKEDLSLHSYARRMMLETLLDTERERVREDVGMVWEEVTNLRAQVAELQTGLTTLAQGVAGPGEAGSAPAAGTEKLWEHLAALEQGLTDLAQEVLRQRSPEGPLRQGVESLRADLAATLEVLMLNLTQAGEEEVTAWVSRNLRREEPPG